MARSTAGIAAERLNRFSLGTGMIALCSMPLSISLSQGFFLLAVISLLIHVVLRQRPSKVTWNVPLRLVLLSGLMLYGSWLVSGVVHSIIRESPEPIMRAIHSDLKDVWLITVAMWVYHHGVDSAHHRRLMFRSLIVSAAILVATGLVSVFTPFRLSRVLYHLQHGWNFSSEARLQHPMFSLPFDLTLHMPVGMLGTHLAFGAQLGFFFIPITLRFIDRWVDKPFFKGWNRTDWIMAGWFGISSFILVLNNARSAMFGVLSALLAGILFLSYRKWKRRAWSLALMPVFVLLIAVVATVVNAEVREFLMQSVGLEKKHSDYQRVMLWSVASELAFDHPLTGVGPGMFSDAVADRMDANAAERPYLWYLYMQTERGHAHNDFLHNLTTAGIPAALMFLCFWASLLYLCTEAEKGEQFPLSPESTQIDVELSFFRPYLAYMPVLLLAGGIFQCYSLDDQVLMPFWMCVGLAALARKAEFSMG